MIQDSSFHHIGYAVRDIVATAEFYTNSGWVLSEIVVDPIQNTQIAFLERDGFPLIELVAPVDENSPICKTLKTSGVTPYHVCYSVADIDNAVAELRAKRFILLFNPVPAVALDNKKISYLMHPQVGLIELIER